MTTILRAYASSRYGQLHYRIAMPQGPVTAPPLLCLHQTPSNGYEWTPLIPGLARDRVVIAPDTPGYGNSDAPPAPASIPDFAGVVQALMDDLAAQGVIAGGAFDVMGAHTGSIIATHLAVTDARVRRLVLFGLAAYPAQERERRLADLLAKFPTPGPTLAHVEALWAIFGELGDARMTAEDRHVGMAECLRLGTRMPWAYQAVYRFDFEGALDRVENPTLIVNPEDDLCEPTRRAAPRLRHGELWELPGKAHGFLKFDGDDVVARIAHFLA
jgi:pimeloyl-ACP methyl ester carboxylesterase